MADFTFTSPQGQKYTVKGPEGATQEQAFNMLQQHLFQSKPDPAQGSMLDAVGASIKDVGIGMGKSVAGLYGAIPRMGLAGTGRINPEGSMQPAAKAFGAQPDTSVSQSVGRIAGDILPYAAAPEFGAGEYALAKGLPAALAGGAGAAAIYKAYMTGGVPGLINLGAMAGMGKVALDRYLPHMLQLVKTHAASLGQTLGGPVEKLGLGAATAAAQQYGGPAEPIDKASFKDRFPTGE